MFTTTFQLTGNGVDNSTKFIWNI